MGKKERIILISSSIVLLLVVSVFIFRKVSWSCGESLKYMGSTYSTVRIGDQCFFIDNLNTDKYSNGDEIKYVAGKSLETVDPSEAIAEEMPEGDVIVLMEESLNRFNDEWGSIDILSRSDWQDRVIESYNDFLSEWNEGMEFSYDIWEMVAGDVFIQLAEEWGFIEWWFEEHVEGDFLEEDLQSKWEITIQGAYSYYDNQEENELAYGKLYNFYAVADERGLCPTGWRVTTDEDWMKTEEYLGMCSGDNPGCSGSDRERGGENSIAEKMKARGFWFRSSDEGITNESRLSVLPGGLLIPTGEFAGLGSQASFWTTNESRNGFAWIRNFRDGRFGVLRISETKNYGASVRCVLDL